MKKQGRIIRSILVGLGIVGAIWFILPLFRYGSINIGTITGVGVFGALFLYGIMLDKVNKGVVLLWKNKKGKVIISIITLCIITVVVLATCTTVCMIKVANKKSDKDVTLVVLGCRVYGENPSIMLVERLEAAYKYLSTDKEVKCILSGGKGNGENISEAECMYRYLIKKGIDKDRLYLEDKSTSTRENLLFSKNIIETEKLNSNIAIVTNEFHEYRASKIAEALKMECSAVSARTAWWLFPTYYVREMYGIIYEWVL